MLVVLNALRIQWYDTALGTLGTMYNNCKMNVWGAVQKARSGNGHVANRKHRIQQRMIYSLYSYGNWRKRDRMEDVWCQ